MRAGHDRLISMLMTGFLAMGVGAKPVGGQAPAPVHPSTRGIYLGGTRLGVTAEVEIERGKEHGLVPTTFEFRSGDRFWLHVTVNQDSYIYVINRTLVGSPQQVTRGVKLMADSDRKGGGSSDTYSLVFPAPDTKNTLVKAGKPTKIPGNGQFFAMDQVAGAEKLLVIASQTPLPLSSTYFNAQSGKLLASGKTVDSASSVLGRLNNELVRMADNTETDEAPKTKNIDTTRGIAIVPNPVAPTPPAPAPREPGKPTTQPAPKQPAPPSGTVGVVRQPGKPLLLDLTLVHLPK
jgi:hypothetical protein